MLTRRQTHTHPQHTCQCSFIYRENKYTHTSIHPNTHSWIFNDIYCILNICIFYMENWCISMGIYSYPILDSDAARKPKATRIISWSAAQHSSSPSYRWNRPKTPWRSISPPLGRSQRGVFPWWEQQTFSKPPRTMMVDDVFLKHQVPLIRAYQPSTFFRERKADTDNPRSVWCEQTWKKRGFLMFFVRVS